MSREQDKNAQLTLRLPAELKEKVQQIAKEQDIDAVVWIRHAIREKLERDSSAAVMPRDLGEVGQLRAELDRKREDELRRYEEQERRLRELEEKLYEKTQLDEAAAELKERMAALEQQLDELTKPNITQNAGRDAKIQVGR